MCCQDTIARAALLAEEILDEVSSADQDWKLIETCALELAEIAAAVGEPATAEGEPPRDS